MWDRLGLQERAYLVATLHRPANVDALDNLANLVWAITNNASGLRTVFPVHPRTARSLEKLGDLPDNLVVVESLPYLEFNYLVGHARGVITDSGGITEEATVLGVPCMTLRDSTERPETVTMGTNVLVGTNPQALAPWLARLSAGQWKEGRIPPLWDGRAGERIVDALINLPDRASLRRPGAILKPETYHQPDNV
jgi:UDP-N-acetylglucosamine 2-epimerase (non-hydrolysing)